MVEEVEPSLPRLGEKIPSFEAQTTSGRIRFPEDYRGKWVVLFSHPADFTPVCTTEFVAFQKRYQEFKKLNCELIGLSIDQVFSHLKWKEWIREKLGVEIEFPIIADDQGRIARLLGMIHPSKGTNTVRAVFIVDPKGILRAMIYYPQELGRNMDEILRAVKALQISDEKGVAMPANWPNNELIGDKVIIPPASDEKTAKERLERAEAKEFGRVRIPLTWTSAPRAPGLTSSVPSAPRRSSPSVQLFTLMLLTRPGKLKVTLARFPAWRVKASATVPPMFRLAPSATSARTIFLTGPAH